MNTVLVTGGNGQLGSALGRCAWPSGWEAAVLTRDDLDLCDLDAIEAMVSLQSWRAVINCAAYTAVDRAESDAVTAWTVNALAPAAIATKCARRNIPMVQVSTDYVFNGMKSSAWEADDPTDPLGVYGASKLGGELAVRTAGCRHAIVRTAWLVSAQGHNFLKTMLRLGTERDVVRVVQDQFGNPTSADDVARGLQSIAIRLAEDQQAPTGVFHLSNAGSTSWAGFAEEIFRQSAERGGPTANVQPIGSSEYPTPAKRPHNSVLSHAAIQTAYGITPRGWKQAIGDILDELIGEKQ